MERLEAQIDEWRSHVARGGVLTADDVEELEEHLREQVSELRAVGLAPDEAFLIAVRRMGSLDAVSREFAREHSGRLWKQLVLMGDEEAQQTGSWVEAFVFALAAAGAVQIARIAAGFPGDQPMWLLRNLGLLVLPFLAGYLARRRGLAVRRILLVAGTFVLAALVINLYPFQDGASTELLVAAHLPVALWFVVAYPYLGGEVGDHERRMDLVRFTGEWFIYYVLIALGGGVLMALTMLILEPIGPDLAETVVAWVLPSGAAGAVVVAAWLVESKQRVVENMAPVLTMVFTPLFAVMLTGTALVYAVSGVWRGFDRELLGVFDALLVVVLGLVLYGMSAREASQLPGWMDRVQLVAVVSALDPRRLLPRRALADRLPARVRRLGRSCRDRAATAVRLRVRAPAAAHSARALRLAAVGG
ncbi:MAG: permease prefix domain 1-containing protein [Nitriliruptoraceae bacterium]